MTSLTVSLGLFYLLMAAIAWWILRSAQIHLAVKIIVPIAILALIFATDLTLPDAFGYPVESAFSALPQQAELIAFVPHDNDRMVDLWLIGDGTGSPRAYSVELTAQLKETLRQARQEQSQGRRAMLAKGGKPAQGAKHPAYTDIDGGEAPYKLLSNSFSLPPKGGAQ